MRRPPPSANADWLYGRFRILVPRLDFQRSRAVHSWAHKTGFSGYDNCLSCDFCEDLKFR
ncbi:hypothetical protein EYZ11_002003 [Aspergillus tanneri]|uniref:Uncharacterized protein n=1 Tax=Aspergillus tanneri TaxID=1220188 RepID=A0A4S3JS82_9EURO|nr:hypothetical protein EYZ11_002003 [Aspergillus tanneri]